MSAVRSKHERWKALCSVVRVAPCWAIVPPRHEARARRGDIALVLEPSMHYGTGTNPLTRRTLGAIPDLCAPLAGRAARVLDLGCGSGVLAIACAKLGVRRVDAMDIDANALALTRLNARYNGVTIRARRTIDRRARYDLVIANLYGVLFDGYRDALWTALAPDGRLWTLGFDARQEAGVVEGFYRRGFVIEHATREAGFAAIVWRKRALR